MTGPRHREVAGRHIETPIPASKRVPPWAPILTEQIRIACRFGLRPRFSLPLLIAGAFWIMLQASRFNRRLEALPQAEAQLLLDQLSFFPIVAAAAAFFTFHVGTTIWEGTARTHFHSLPVNRRTHSLWRVAAKWLLAMVYVAGVLALGGLYAVLIGQPDRYLTELATYAPIVIVGPTIVFLLAAAVDLSVGWGIRQSIFGLAVLLLLAVFGFGFVVTGHPGFTHGDMESFSYRWWLPIAGISLAASVAAVIRAARHNVEDPPGEGSAAGRR